MPGLVFSLRSRRAPTRRGSWTISSFRHRAAPTSRGSAWTDGGDRPRCRHLSQLHRKRGAADRIRALDREQGRSWLARLDEARLHDGWGPNPDVSSFAPVQSLSATSTGYAGLGERAVVAASSISSQSSGIPPATVEREGDRDTGDHVGLLRPPFASQPASAGRAQPPIATNDDRVLDSVWENGRLWFTTNTACMPAGGLLFRACARVVELSTANGTVYAGRHDSPSRTADLFFPFGSGRTRLRQPRDRLRRVRRRAQPRGRRGGAVAGRDLHEAPIVIAQSAGAYPRRPLRRLLRGGARSTGTQGLVWWRARRGPTWWGGRGWATVVSSVSVTAAGGDAASRCSSGGRPRPCARVHGGRARGHVSTARPYRALADGSGVRTGRRLLGHAGSRRVHRRRLRSLTLLLRQTSTAVQWRPSKKLRGTFSRLCAQHLVDGRHPVGPELLPTVTLRLKWSSPSSCAAYTGAVGASS